MIETLKRIYGENQPIFTNEILSAMNNYSRPRIFQLLKKYLNEGRIIKFDKGVYYIPTETRYGKSIISVEQVVKKKYISNNNEVFGIYSGLNLKQNFLITNQIPSTLEVITNNETMSSRKIVINNRNVILRKSRLPISKENVNEYTLLELFTIIDIDTYNINKSIKREVIDFVKENEIKAKDIYELAISFPAKTIKNIMESGILNEFA